MNVFIYALKDPDTEEVRYVGKTKHPKIRLQQHVWEANRKQNRRACWVRSLLKNGKRPILEIVDEVPVAMWSPVEAAYVQFFSEAGAKLVNGTPGGDAGPDGTGTKRSSETRAKMSARLMGNSRGRGHVVSAEHRESIRRALVGVPKSVEARAKMSLAKTGKKHPNFGKRRSEEICKRQSEAVKMWWKNRKEAL